MRKYFFLLVAVLVISPLAAFAALININTASQTELETLPGIGPSKAAAIVQYRTDHGPFAAISDVQNVSGIGPSTYAQISPLITVGDTGTTTTGETQPTASSTPATSGGSSTYEPPPSSISVDAGPDLTAYLEVPVHFTVQVKTKGSALDSSAEFAWSFGDGSVGTGNPAQKTYHYPGTYLVRVTVSDGGTIAHDEVIVTVLPSWVSIPSVTGEGIVIENDGETPLDLSGWRLSSGTGMFRIPEGTLIMGRGSVLFPYAVTNLLVGFDATLAYPDGMIATRYTPPLPVQPSLVAVSSTSTQTNAPAEVLSPPAHAQEAVSAPAAATDIASAGAALTAAADARPASGTSKMNVTGLLHSPWAYGLLGVVATAAGVFMIL